MAEGEEVGGGDPQDSVRRRGSMVFRREYSNLGRPERDGTIVISKALCNLNCERNDTLEISEGREPSGFKYKK